MESANFNLQQSVDRYINRIKNQGSVTGADAAELKAHLFDAVDELNKTGLSEEESLIIACKRLGSEDLLSEEFAKVNTSLQTNKIWTYLILGFNLLYSLSSLLFTFVGLFYLIIYRAYHSSSTSTFIITAFNLVFITFVWFIVKKKKKISKFLEIQVENNALRIVGLSFIPLLINIGTARLNKSEALHALTYPVYKFESGVTEFSYTCA